MKRYAYILFILTLLMPASLMAQRHKKTVRKTVKKQENVVVDPRIQQMLASTQQIIFIDSLVVDKNHFMQHIPLSAESGIIEQKDTLGQFTNELKDYRFTTYFDATDSATHIAQSNYIGNMWTEPVRVGGIDDASANFPFLMPDGTTLYFAQQGEKSIGGYDIFVTRYDSDSGTFLRPENIGMPFASEANDYFYAIDEATNLGYFVTDRRQPAGKVCIYIFIPNETRKVYQSEAYAEEQLLSLAKIDRIADTWQNKDEVKNASQRLKACKEQQKQSVAPKAKTLLDNLRHQADVLEKALQIARNFYAHASESDRQTLRNEILKSEKELESLQVEIRTTEKKQRNEQYKFNN